MEKKSNNKSLLRLGTLVLVIFIVILINLIVAGLPQNIRSIDISNTKIYEISDVTTEYLKGLENTIDIKVLSTKSSADERIINFLDKYKSLSDKINIEWIDPVLTPSALDTYGAEVDDIVVINTENQKQRLVNFADIIVIDYMTLMSQGTYSELEFDGEGQITGAINYVTSDRQEKVYMTAGHGEMDMIETLKKLLSRNNCEVDTINMTINANIPADCSLLIIDAPENDFGEEELSSIRNYMGKGGDVMVVFPTTENPNLINIKELLKEYGINTLDGLVADTQRATEASPFFFFPEIKTGSELSVGLNSKMVFIANSTGFLLDTPKRDTISTTEFMSTGDNGYIVTDEDKEQGRFVVGAVATEKLLSGESSRLTVFGSETFIDEGVIDNYTNIENSTLFLNAVTANFDDGNNLSIKGKDLTIKYNNVRYAGILSFLFIFVLPITVLVIGFVVWMKRRKL